ncbi:MAG TPA: DUF3794 domain-containing protein [Candidatus Coproplasma excrementipullorum]|nr:DUF3794 domain-containing protein [Candidatus Coproplasma excrementipullorum]
MIKPQTGSLSYTRKAASLTAQTVVQTRLSQSDGISEVLVVCPQVSLLNCEVSSGRVNYSGKIIFTVVYSDEEGKLCRMQKGAEFSHFCDDDELAPAQTAVCALSCEKVTTRRDGSAIIISAVVTAEINVFAPAERTFITACEGAYLKTQTKEFFSFITFSGECEVEDDFDADGVDDILVPSACALVTSAECGTGEVNVSGEINLSLLAMRRAFPASLERVIPFRCEVPCEDSFSGALPAVRAEIRDMNVNATVDDERGKCRVEFSCTVAVSGYFAQRTEQTVATDAFSCTNTVSGETARESARIIAERKLYSERINSPAAAKAKLDFTCRFLAVACPVAEYEYVPASGAVEGGVSAILLYEQGGDVKSTAINIPFSVRVSAAEGASAQVSVCGVSVKQPTEGQIEGEALIKVSAAYPRVSEAEYLCSVEEGAALTPSESAVTVIIPSPGDGLWDAARRLGCPPEEVAAANPDLKYPLTGGERILVYRKK